MTDNEFLLQDRIQKIQQIINKYEEENFYISFSGGKDSTVLSALIDIALPTNKIPRVYANTGIDLNMIRDFVFELKETDDRIIDIKPSIPIKLMLEEDGYPFKSKVHSRCVMLYQNFGFEKNMVNGYLGKRPEFWHSPTCPKKLLFHFTDENKLKISDMCCIRLKEEPLISWATQNGKDIAIIGTMRDEGGRRGRSGCLQFQGKKLKQFKPLIPVTKDWEDWVINEYNIKICDIYIKNHIIFHERGVRVALLLYICRKSLIPLKSFFQQSESNVRLYGRQYITNIEDLGID